MLRANTDGNTSASSGVDIGLGSTSFERLWDVVRPRLMSMLYNDDGEEQFVFSLACHEEGEITIEFEESMMTTTSDDFISSFRLGMAIEEHLFKWLSARKGFKFDYRMKYVSYSTSFPR